MSTITIIRDEKRPDTYTLQVRDARLKYKNFKGEGNEMNREGNRTVNLVIDDPEVFQFLLEDGWRFRTPWRDYNNKDLGYAEPFEELADGRVAYPHTQLRVNFDAKRPPKVFLHTSVNPSGMLLTEDNIEELDDAWLKDIKVSVNPSSWSVRGESGKKGYLNVMHCTLVEDDPFAEDYSSDDGDQPEW